MSNTTTSSTNSTNPTPTTPRHGRGGPRKSIFPRVLKKAKERLEGLSDKSPALLSAEVKLAKLDKLALHAKNTLKLDVNGPKPKIVGKCKADGTIGTDSCSESSIKTYYNIWNGMLEFCLAMDDYDSAVILNHDNCPTNPPPVSLDTAIHYLRYNETKT